jgi:peptide/nickel transport system substrate-binding protein
MTTSIGRRKFAAGVDSAASARAAGSKGGTLTLLVDPEPTTLVTVTNPADPSLLVSAKTTEGLLAYDFELNPKPQLATNWAAEPGGKAFTFTLRRGVKWHDGVDFTAADVAFSIMLLKEVHPRGRATFANVTEVVTPTPNTVTIKLSKPAPYLLWSLAACECPIVPKHIYEGTDATTNPNGKAPVGTGPFLFKEWVRGKHILYERNPNYWDKPKPYVDRLVVRFITDAADRVSAIAAGEISLAPATPVPLSTLDRLMALPHLGFETNGYQYTNQIVRLEFNLDSPYLKDLKVRQAIAHAIDRKDVLDAAWYGRGEVAFGPISPDLKRFHSKDVPVHAFDLSMAERLLDEAGFPRGTNGIRFRLNHDYVPAGDGYERTADSIKRALAAVGIDVAIRTQDFPAYIKRVYTDRDFDFTTGRANNMFDPTVGVQRLFWSRNFRKGVPFSNGSHYENAEVDYLLEAAAVEADPVLRLQYFADFQKIIARDLPDLTLLAPAQITIHDAKVVDHTVTADGVAGNLADAFIRM